MARAVTLSMALLLVAACGEPKPPPAPAATRSQPPGPPSAPGGAPAHDAVSEAAASYRTAATIQPATLDRGGKGELIVTIEMTRQDVHVQQEFPLKVTLAGSPGIGLASGTLGHGEAVDPAAKGRVWKVGVNALAAGTHHAEVALRFAICKETEPEWCVVRNDKVSASVAVR